MVATATTGTQCTSTRLPGKDERRSQGHTEGACRVECKLAQIIFDSISDGVFTVDRDCVITSFNKAAERITGFTCTQAIGKHCFEVFRTEVCHTQCPLRDTLKRHDTLDNVRVTMISQDRREVPISVSTTLLQDEDGQVVGAVEFFRDLTETEHLRARLGQNEVLGTVVSCNPTMKRLVETLPNIAAAECNVLIQGPSGSGKELIAQAVHNLSPRRYGPYIKLNCAALPATLLESELFGYVKGAFTDAKRDKPGQFSLADGGTLLLDEISEMDVSLQVKLLRVLNNGEYQPLGSTRTMQADARIIASTNADLQQALSDGSFREDLFFRLNVVSLELPPLRDRPEDIPLLAEHFIKKFDARFRKGIHRLDGRALAVLRRYHFPGNVRELENAMEHAFVMCQGQDIAVEHLPDHVVRDGLMGRPSGAVAVQSERQVIEEALRRNLGNRQKVAHELDMHRTTLWRKMKAYGLQA